MGLQLRRWGRSLGRPQPLTSRLLRVEWGAELDPGFLFSSDGLGAVLPCSMAYMGYRWADDPKIQSHLGGPWWRFWIPKAESDAAMKEGRYGADDLFGVTRMFYIQ